MQGRGIVEKILVLKFSPILACPSPLLESSSASSLCWGQSKAHIIYIYCEHMQWVFCIILSSTMYNYRDVLNESGVCNISNVQRVQ